MCEDYRVRKVTIDMNERSMEDYLNPYHVPNFVTRYVVQVRGFIFWHTVKTFKKIRPAARLLNFLKHKDND